jgi:adenylate cyclase
LPSDLNLLSIMGGQIALALENARLYAVERQRAEALAQALEQRRELDRLKDEFIRNVSHELRTPLAMILGYMDLLASGELGELGAGQQEPMNIVLERARFLRELVEDVTAVLVNESRQRPHEPVSMADLTTSSLTDFQVLARQSDLTLQGYVAPEIPLVLGDAFHLRMVVDNLISNALKFTPAGGTVSVNLRKCDARVVLQVADTGIGIAPEHQVRVFDRFFQVDGSLQRTYEGSGLGLALVREIVQAHSGEVTVESQLGQGSTFTVWLPVALPTA